MKGVLLAGGTGSRLAPLTAVTNKHLLPVGHEPMVFHPLRKLQRAGVTEVLLVTGREHMGDMIELLGSGRDLGLSLTYRVQDEPAGIAQALSLAEVFAAGSLLAVVLGDNVFEDELAGPCARFREQGRGARILLKAVPDPERFGVAEVREGRVTRILEKPERPPSDLAVTGAYFYDARVFDLVRGLRPSARGELEITDVNNAYLAAGELEHEVLAGWWTDAGTFPSLLRANALALGYPPPDGLG
ncbi:NTP transferase domain-containing protein [Myxococcota bacterium]|nr:NTP transferase domain-containing protein [Myxococcota bacterium]